MRAYIDDKLNKDQVRIHPWSCGDEGTSARYYDFKTNPELIPEGLEDLRPYRELPAAQTFYDLIRWLNGPRSIFESNDSGFAPPLAGLSQRDPERHQAEGRLMIFFRRLEINTRPDTIAWLKQALAACLDLTDHEFEDGVIALSQAACHFNMLQIAGREPEGREVVISFWAYGRTEEETWRNLNRLLLNLTQSIQEVSRRIHSSNAIFRTPPPLPPSAFDMLVASADYERWDAMRSQGDVENWNKTDPVKHLRHPTEGKLLCGESLSDMVFAGTLDRSILRAGKDILNYCPTCTTNALDDHHTDGNGRSGSAARPRHKKAGKRGRHKRRAKK